MGDERGEDLPATDSDILRGWKDIAAFLRTSERTAQRWGAELNLPIHRSASVAHPSVFAFRAELLAWQKAQDASFIGVSSSGDADVAADKPTPVPIEAGRDWRRLLGWGCGTLLVALGAVAIVAPSALSPDTGREATPFLEFRVVVAHGSPSTLVARSGSSITLRPDGHPAVLLSPILQDEYVLLEVRQSTDSVLARKDVGPLLLRAHLKPGVQVRMDRPFRLTVEWTGRRAAASK